LQPHFEGSVRSPLTLPKIGLGSPPGLPKTQNTIAWVKTPRIEVFFIPFVLKCRCTKWPRMSHLDICSTSYGGKKGQESNWQFDSRPLKVGNQLDFGVCRWSTTHRWKALEERYKFALDLVPIGGWNEKLWTPKIPRVQTRTVLGFHFGSLGKKCHSDASAAVRRRKYYMGEGGGFPQVQAVVSQVSPGLLMACPSTKGASECELTNLLVSFGCRFEWVNSLSLFLV